MGFDNTHPIGHGMPPEGLVLFTAGGQAVRLPCFEPFRQEEGAFQAKAAGLGLGLAICQQIIELHGGTIRADSAGTNRGATFTVRLPRSSA